MISVHRGRLEAAEVANNEVSVIFADKFQGIESLGVEVVEIDFISWDDFEAVDFLEVEAFKVLFLLVDIHGPGTRSSFSGRRLADVLSRQTGLWSSLS